MCANRAESQGHSQAADTPGVKTELGELVVLTVQHNRQVLSALLCPHFTWASGRDDGDQEPDAAFCVCSIRGGCHSLAICARCCAVRRWFGLRVGDAAPQKEALEASLCTACYFLPELLDSTPVCLVVCSSSWVAGGLLEKIFLPGCCSLAVLLSRLA